MTGDQHMEYTSIRQQVSRNSLPTLLYFLFSPPQIFFNSILACRTSGTFGFAPIHKADPSAKQKEPLFANTRNITSKNINLKIVLYKFMNHNF